MRAGRRAVLQTFRSATIDDLPVILALLAEDAIRYVAEPAESTDRQRAAITHPGHRLPIARDDEFLVHQR